MSRKTSTMPRRPPRSSRMGATRALAAALLPRGAGGRPPRPRGAVLGDVAENEHNAKKAAPFVPDGSAAVADRDLASVPGKEERVVGKPGNDAAANHLVHRAFHRFAGRLAHDVENLGVISAEGF